jgi:phospholipase D-like protein
MASRGHGALIKLLVEVVLAIFLHPLAFILCIVDIVNRTDLSGFWKFLWILITFVWGIGPILYILFGRGKFW